MEEKATRTMKILNDARIIYKSQIRSLQLYDPGAEADDEELQQQRAQRRLRKMQRENAADIKIRDPLVSDYQRDQRTFVFDPDSNELRCLEDRITKTYIVARRRYDIGRKCFFTEYVRDTVTLKEFCQRQKRWKLYVGKSKMRCVAILYCIVLYCI